MTTLFRDTVLVLVGMLAAGCLGDVSHTNPLDPLAPNFNDVGVVAGTVSDRGLIPISSASVQLLPDGRLTTTNSNGEFSFVDIPVGDYTVHVDAEGFDQSVDSVVVDLGRTTSSAHQLNGLPVFEGGEFSTVHISRWWPENDLYRLDILVEVDDVDGLIDIELVTVEIAPLGFTDTLATAGSPGFYQISILETDLMGSTVHSVVGMPIVIHVIDRAGSAKASDPQSLVRVIDPVPVAVSPQGLETINGVNPQFDWDPVFLPYTHTFTVDVVRVDNGVQTSVFNREDISSDSLSVVVPTTLTTGSYIWTIAAVDAFGDLSRSKEAGFQVQ